MTYLNLVLGLLVVGLFIVNVYQFLTQRAALRIAEILYIMSRHVREKASEVKHESKDVEIVEAHLFGIATSARILLRTLGRKENTLGPDPAVDLPSNAPKMDNESLVRLADNILYAVKEDAGEATWDEIVDKALDKFQEKVPTLDREGAKRIMAAVARQHKPNGSYTLPLEPQAQM